MTRWVLRKSVARRPAGFKYTIAASWIPKLEDMNKQYDPMGRYNAVMDAADLFNVEPLAAAQSPPK
jgi:hypothetical protein